MHGIIDGQYVAGDVRIKRIAKYHPRTGIWTGRLSADEPLRHQEINKDSPDSHPPTEPTHFNDQVHPARRRSKACPHAPCLAP